MHRLYTWLRSHPTLVDGAWAALLLLVTLPEALHAALPPYHPDAPDRYPIGQSMPAGITGAAAALTIAVATTFKRRRPVATSFAALAAGIAQLAAGSNVTPMDVALLAILYNAACYGPRWLSRTGLVAGVLGGPAAMVRFDGISGDSLGPAIVAIALSAAPFLVAWAFGDAVRSRRAYYASLEDRTRRLEREREAQATAAAAAERARIARELHDVVAHNVSVMVVQADGAKYVLDADPAQAREALETISGTGRQALAEMRRLLGVLRSEEATEFVPQPGVDQIGELLEQVRGTGLPVDFTVDGEVRPLPRGVELTVFRIVQEALTNTRKHGGPAASAAVRLYYRPADLEVTIEDDGRGAMAALYEGGGDDGLGHGLIGMRERVGMVRGTFDAGPRPGGGFRISAVLPLPAAEVAQN